MKHLFTSVCAVALSLFVLPACASTEKPFYMGIDAGGASVQLVKGIAFGDTERSDSQPTSFLVGNVHAGYEFDESVAIELGYFRTGDKSKKVVDTSFGAPITVDSSVRYSGVSLDLVGNYPLIDNLYILGSLGGAFVKKEASVSVSDNTEELSADGSDDKTALKLGTGLKYDINSSLSLRTKIDYLDVERAMWMYTVGIQFNL